MNSRSMTALESILLLFFAATNIAHAQSELPDYSCCESKIDLKRGVKPTAFDTSVVRAGASVTLEAILAFHITFECSKNIEKECVGKFDVSLEKSPSQRDARGEFIVDPNPPGKVTILNYPRKPCDGIAGDGIAYIKWTATYPTNDPVAGYLVLKFTMPPAPPDKGIVNDTFTTFGWYDGTTLQFPGEKPDKTQFLDGSFAQAHAFSCCEDSIALGPKPEVKKATSTFILPTKNFREVDIQIKVPINFSCNKAAPKQQCIGRFDAEVTQNPTQGTGVEPIVSRVELKSVVKKECGTGPQKGVVEMDWRGVYPDNKRVTGTLSIRITIPAIKAANPGGLDVTLDVPDIDTTDKKGDVKTGKPTVQ